jgi:pimeloyl-ACP methyl ester carboxylesterase
VEPGLGEYVLTARMFEEARDWLLLDGPIPITAPVHVLQGRADDTVPWTHAMKLAERLTGGDVRLDLIEGGDHRLSTPRDLDRLIAAVEAMRQPRV